MAAPTQPTSTSKRPRRQKNPPAGSANLGSPARRALTTPTPGSTTQQGDAQPLAAQESADAIQRLQDRIAELERSQAQTQLATNLHTRRQRSSRRHRRGQPTIVDGVIRSRSAPIPTVELPEMTGGRSPGSRPPRSTDPLVQDNAGPGSPPGSGDDLTGFSRASNYSASRYRPYELSPKVKDPPELTDGVDPTFPAWRKLLLGKFLRNDDHFRSDAEKMAFIFGITGGTAQRLLDPLYLTDSPYALTTSQQMIDHLATCFENSQERADARDTYATTRQSPQESFRDFRVQFIDVANRAEIPEDTQLEDIFRKIRPELQEGLLTDRRRWRNLPQAVQEIDALDKERTSYLLRTCKQRQAQTSSQGIVAGTIVRLPPAPRALVPLLQRSSTPYAPLQRSSTPLRLGTPAREQTSAPETRTCYNCGKAGHLSADCLAPKKERALQELEPEDREQVFAEDPDSESESGNEEA
jgi:hypothetical protein